MSKPLQHLIGVWLQKCINDEVDYGSHEADVDFDEHVDEIQQAILDWHQQEIAKARLNEVQNAYGYWVNGRKFISSYFEDRIAELSQTLKDKEAEL